MGKSGGHSVQGTTDHVTALQATLKAVACADAATQKITVMKRSHYAVALGLLGLLMVVGARDARAQQIEAPVCYLLGQNQYWLTIMHLGPANVSPRPFILGGYRMVGQAVEPLSGGGVESFDAQSHITWIGVQEAIATGGTPNPAATTLIVLVNRSGQVSQNYWRTEYGSSTPPIATQGTVTACH